MIEIYRWRHDAIACNTWRTLPLCVKQPAADVVNHILKRVPCEAMPPAKAKLPKRKIGHYKAVHFPFKYVPELF